MCHALDSCKLNRAACNDSHAVWTPVSALPCGHKISRGNAHDRAGVKSLDYLNRWPTARCSNVDRILEGWRFVTRCMVQCA